MYSLHKYDTNIRVILRQFFATLQDEHYKTMAIYTKKGDKGYTSLFNGKRISKSNIYAHALGSIDEINSTIGLACSLLEQHNETYRSILKATQKLLLTLGSDLAGGPVHIGAKETENLERIIDYYQNKMPELTNFILPGGHPASAALHVARTDARRAERIVAELNSETNGNEDITRFINRLSDYLFVLARAINIDNGFTDEVWIGSETQQK